MGGSVDRRTMLAGTAGLLLLGACGGGKDTKPEATKGPVILEQDEGNVVRPEDTAALAARLKKAFDAHDLAALTAVAAETSPAFRKRWKRRFDNFERMKVIEGSWLVGAPQTRARNSSGGALEYDGSLVFAHQIAGCDGRPVVESYDARLRKKSEDAPLELLSVGDAKTTYEPAIWDYTTTDVITTKHAVIAFRPQDRARAEASKGAIDAGFARAMELVPPAKGVSKVFVALTWPSAKDVLWGGAGLKDALGTAWPHAYLKPEEVAKGQASKVGDDGAYGTARTGLHPEAFNGNTPVTIVARHEAVHALADQWGGSAPRWGVEGLARWSETPGKVVGTNPRVRSVFADFARRVQRPETDFYGGSNQQINDNYNCAAAVYDYVYDRKGRKGVLDLAERLYAQGKVADDDDATAKLFAKVQKWL